ncbi:hypothetical protein B0T26DRAFT_737375 [Lasiosphaeria miniovina]|uniref:Glycosyl hydrolase n=1 Tax=Lasiosphaeria miniovina TaxID=1954250 RepID=A0AA40EET8_9PEZI|nr:uncharacterized protein B0T26DRAFT_737375 [Lasiosphaeria miniovina]KAK0734871.1 hypothetical protein B0T26DRAFT_737375 [Lasiosphaeria miniovina]
MLVRWSKVVAFATGACASASFLPPHLANDPRNSGPLGARAAVGPDLQLFNDTLDALRVLQDAYFEPWVGTWPSAIDWTAAVMGSHVAGALLSLSRGLELVHPGMGEGYLLKENTISLYFSQLIGFYFGQDAFAIRGQAFDDMLWVVLGWLDAVKFIDTRIGRDLEVVNSATFSTGTPQNDGWHGNLWVPAFAHRARIFWELASVGWDTKLCGGGMNWNPRLTPYKNAITNELYIAGSISMYIYFPGDSNAAPFGANHGRNSPPAGVSTDWKPHDPIYLTAAVDGYEWLASSNMTNSKGLYVDGFHVSGYDSGGNNTKCDERDEMVYTYNQGVILSGQLGLFQVTGNPSYLREGHRLIQSVIWATGYDLARDQPIDDLAQLFPKFVPPWHGLGRAGILEEACDIKASCSQDGQTFKGIWMHHFTAFCSPLEPTTANQDTRSFDSLRTEHSIACHRYIGWLEHNAAAARGTRDSEGKFGMWWTAGLPNFTALDFYIPPDALPDDDGVVDYRNDGVPDDPLWMLLIGKYAKVLPSKAGGELAVLKERSQAEFRDPNSRGLGRTVETQGGGLAVLRALWELSKQSL